MNHPFVFKILKRGAGISFVRLFLSRNLIKQCMKTYLRWTEQNFCTSYSWLDSKIFLITSNYFKIFSNDLSASWVALSNSLMVSHKNRYDETMSYQQRVWRHRGSIIHSYYSSIKILASKKHSQIKLKPSRKVWICIFEQLAHQVNYLSEVLILN